MIQGHSFDSEHRIFQHGEERPVSVQCWNACLLGGLKSITCSKQSLENLILVEFPNFDGEGIAIHEIPSIAAQFAMDIIDQARWTEQFDGFASSECDAKNSIKSYEMIYVCMGDENRAGPEQSGRSQSIVVPEVEEHGPLRPADVHVDTGITEYIVDQISGEGWVHRIILYRRQRITDHPIAALTALYITMTSTA